MNIKSKLCGCWWYDKKILTIALKCDTGPGTGPMSISTDGEILYELKLLKTTRKDLYLIKMAADLVPLYLVVNRGEHFTVIKRINGPVIKSVNDMIQKERFLGDAGIVLVGKSIENTYEIAVKALINELEDIFHAV